MYKSRDLHVSWKLNYEKLFQWNGGGSAIALLSTLLFIEFQAKQYNPATWGAWMIGPHLVSS